MTDNDYKLNEESYIEFMANLLENDKEKFIIEICRQLNKLNRESAQGKCSDEEDCYKRYLGNKKRYRTEMFDNVKKTDEILTIIGKWGGWVAAFIAIILNFVK